MAAADAILSAAKAIDRDTSISSALDAMVRFWYFRVAVDLTLYEIVRTGIVSDASRKSHQTTGKELLAHAIGANNAG